MFIIKNRHILAYSPKINQLAEFIDLICTLHVVTEDGELDFIDTRNYEKKNGPFFVIDDWVE